MKLNINDDKELGPDLDEDRLRGALQGLAVDEFAVLAQEDQHYIQTYRETDADYVLEFRAGSSDQHFATPAPISLDEVLDAFCAYFGGRFEGWKSGVLWERALLGP